MPIINVDERPNGEVIYSPYVKPEDVQQVQVRPNDLYANFVHSNFGVYCLIGEDYTEEIMDGYNFAIWFIYNCMHNPIQCGLDFWKSPRTAEEQAAYSLGIRIADSIIQNNVLSYNIAMGKLENTVYSDIELDLCNINLTPAPLVTNVYNFNRVIDRDVISKATYLLQFVNKGNNKLVVLEGSGVYRYTSFNFSNISPIPLNVKNSSYYVDNRSSYDLPVFDPPKASKQAALDVIYSRVGNPMGNLTICCSIDTTETYRAIYPNNTMQNIPTLAQYFGLEQAAIIYKSIDFTTEQTELNRVNNLNERAGVLIISVTGSGPNTIIPLTDKKDPIHDAIPTLFNSNPNYYVNTGYISTDNAISIGVGCVTTFPTVDLYFISAAELLTGAITKEDTAVTIISGKEIVSNTISNRIASNPNSSYYKRNVKTHLSSSKTHIELDMNLPSWPTIPNLYTNLFNKTIPIVVNKDLTLPDKCSVRVYTNNNLIEEVNIPIQSITDYNLHTDPKDCKLSNATIEVENKELEKKQLEVEKLNKELQELERANKEKERDMQHDLEKMQLELTKLNTQLHKEQHAAEVELAKLKLELESTKKVLEEKTTQEAHRTLQEEERTKQTKEKLHQEQEKTFRTRIDNDNSKQKYVLELDLEKRKAQNQLDAHNFKLTEQFNKMQLDTIANLNKQTIEAGEKLLKLLFAEEEHKMHMEEQYLKKTQAYTDNLGKIITTVNKFI